MIFHTGVGRHPRGGGTQSPHAVAAYGLATAHTLLCIVNGDDSAVFRLFVPGDLDLRTRAIFLYSDSVSNRQI